MVKQIWLNLPVKDVIKSKAFFSKIGFSFNNQHETATSACMLVGDNNFVIMLFEEATFEKAAQNGLVDTTKNSEVLISIDAQSRTEVEDFANKVLEAGGTVFAQPAEIQGWMYGCGFADVDGHRWNILYMDYSKLPK